jgi:hypothetical protein
MLEHYIDMVLATDPAFENLPASQKTAVREIKKAVRMADPSFFQVTTKCKTEVSRKEYTCSQQSKNPDEWQACIE